MIAMMSKNNPEADCNNGDQISGETLTILGLLD